MITLKETHGLIMNDEQHWLIYLMDFVDDFRFNNNIDSIKDSFLPSEHNMDAILASTAEYLCNELSISTPAWLQTIKSVKNPWFVSGLESLKAISLVESPVYFRKRKIFVLENFLQRV